MDKQIRILLIDDETDFLESMAFWFKSKGYAVTSMSNSKEALRMIQAIAPDIVFLDIIMPEMDGLTVLKKIREFNKTLPIILMSAFVDESKDEKKDNLYGVSHIFYKDDGFSKAQDLLESALKKGPKGK